MVDALERARGTGGRAYLVVREGAWLRVYEEDIFGGFGRRVGELVDHGGWRELRDLDGRQVATDSEFMKNEFYPSDWDLLSKSTDDREVIASSGGGASIIPSFGSGSLGGGSGGGDGSDFVAFAVVWVIAFILVGIFTLWQLSVVGICGLFGITLPGPAPHDTPTAIEITLASAGLDRGYEGLLLLSDEQLLAPDGSIASISPAFIAKPEANGGGEMEPGATALYIYGMGKGTWYMDAADFVAPGPVSSTTEQEWNEHARESILSGLSCAFLESGWTVEDVQCVQFGDYRFTATYSATGPGGEEGSGRVLGVYLGPGESITGNPSTSGIIFSVPEGAKLGYGPS